MATNGEMIDIIAATLESIGDAIEQSDDPTFADQMQIVMQYWVREQIRLTNIYLAERRKLYTPVRGIIIATKRLEDLKDSITRAIKNLEVANQVVGAVSKLLNALK